MKNETFVARLIDARRLHNSTYGNPRYALTFSTPDHRLHFLNTSANAQIAFQIGNAGLREGCIMEVTIGGRGTVTNLKPEAEWIGYCEWFAGCRNQAATTRRHPVLGDVPICDSCDEWYGGLS